MHIEHEGIALWYGTSDAPAPEGGIPLGADVQVTVGVKPVDAGNRVEVIFSVNGGPLRTAPAQWLYTNPAGKAQYFRARLPGFCADDTVEYAVLCRCAGRQVPPPDRAASCVSIFHVTEVEAK